MAFPETIAIMVRDAFDGPVRGYRAELVAPSTGAGATFAATLPSSDVSDASGVITLAVAARSRRAPMGRAASGRWSP